MNVGDKNHWIIEDVIGAGKRALARATAFDNPLRLFVEELEGKKDPPEVRPRGATCAGTPKPPSEPFTCMSDDCPLKEARIRRAEIRNAPLDVPMAPLVSHGPSLPMRAAQRA